MAIVTLRAYLDEVQDLIGKEALEEAIGHCKYILQSFPKNVVVYRLLGQALLGKARHQEASDVFQRLLSAVPDDMTAHIAMSELYVEQDAIPQATWHLERAFEQDPNNQVLKDELRRMYQQRDGTAPDRVQLTRGALAKLYYRGRLYEQATAELQAILETETDRPDLLLLLAQTLWDNGHQVEAGETALRVLEMLPDALEANALLAGLWLQQKRPSDAAPFIERVQALDPIRALALLAPDNPSVADEITLPHFDWVAHANVAMLTDTPEWVQEVGDSFQKGVEPEHSSDPFGLERKAGAVSADWMTNFAAPGDSAPPAPDWFAAPVSPPEPAMPAASIPDAANAMPDWFAEVNQSAPLPSAEEALPSWLAEEKPASAPVEPPRTASGYTELLGQIASVRGQDQPIPSWTDESPVAPEESPIPSWTDKAPAVSESTNDMPDWFANWDSPASSETTFGPDQSLKVGQSEPASDAPSDSLNWMSEPAQDVPSIQPDSPIAAPDNTPDWMSEVAPVEPATTASSVPLSSSEPVVSADAPDWLSDLGAVSQTPATEFTSDESEAVPGNRPDWMGELAPVEPAIESAEPVSPSEPAISESTPDWLSGLGDDSQPSDIEFTPPAPEAAAGNMPDWMSELAPVEPTAESIAPISPSEPTPSASTPDWLSDLGAVSQVPATELTAAEPEAAPDNTPDWMSELASVEPNIESALPKTDLPANTSDWLGSLTIPEASSQPEPFAAASTPGDLPDWMSTLGVPGSPASTDQPSETESPAEPAVSEAPSDDLLNDLAAVSLTPNVEPEVESAHAAMPDWMSELAPSDVPVESTTPPEPESEPAQVAMPDWMSELAPSEAPVESITPPEPESEPAQAAMPDWMSELASSEASVEPAVQSTSPSPTPEPELEENWLRGFEAESSAEPSLSSISAHNDVPAPENDRDWLASVGSITAKSDDDWLSGFGVVDSPEEPSTQKVSDEESDRLTDELASPPQTPEPANLASTPPMEMLDILSEPPSEPEIDTESPFPASRGMTGLLNVLSKSADESRRRENPDTFDVGQTPDWLAAFNDEPVPNEAGTQPRQAASVEPTPVEQSATPLEESGADTPDWLRDMGLGEVEPTVQAQEALPTSPENPGQNPYKPSQGPDFISPRAPQSSEPAKENVGTSFRFDKSPAWMRKLKNKS